MLKQNAVSINSEKVTDPDLEVELTEELVIKVGKRRFAKITKK